MRLQQRAWRRRDPTRRLRGWERRDLRDGGGVRWAHEWGRRRGGGRYASAGGGPFSGGSAPGGVHGALQGVGHGEAVEAAYAAVRAEPLRESAHRILVRIHLAEGNVVEALRVFDQFRTSFSPLRNCTLTSYPTAAPYS